MQIWICFQAGIIEEMLEDTMESMDDQEELEDAAQEEVDKILFEVTSGKIFFFFLYIYFQNRKYPKH